MRKEDILREELSRMRVLMGINGSLYQKPFVHEGEEGMDKGHDIQFGKGSKEPNPKDYKKGKDDEHYQKDHMHWKEHNTPKFPPLPKPKPPAPKPPLSPRGSRHPDDPETIQCYGGSFLPEH